jgi:hypothetical protein
MYEFKDLNLALKYAILLSQVSAINKISDALDDSSSLRDHAAQVLVSWSHADIKAIAAYSDKADKTSFDAFHLHDLLLDAVN